MTCCHLASDVDKQEAIVVRTYGVLKGDLLSRDKEIMGMQLGHIAGCCAPLMGIFNNGHIYGYAQGRTLEYEDFFKPEVIRYSSHITRYFTLVLPAHFMF